ncbi:uncharacterized protein isoform X1 [Danio rerio]|uniref:Si:ch211-125e6.11 n=1 Tax=Danio rerio TaxID=7955 RepID=B3DIG2_DANRE|nr:uncharacterized protein LOC100170830 precursor [Danio rerio]XP_005167715.1 uncharacterized protein LOC100170830 isoform X1 [Danio rerio]AAI63116.1 Si:ch211-125e6.11 [Danio rerio]AAI63133.1 Si:ch211-125e6.11 [Danio rerio]|eukprot:NP_001124136.1 uncharacterized protein LOC100170830 precursor [Danio rerio]
MAMLRNLLLLFMLSIGNASGSCPYGWINTGVKCYKFFSQSVSWITAEKNCQGFGGNLASVHNRLENDFLMNMVPSSSRCWIGGHDGEQEGQWLWTDGSMFDYNNWCSDEPNNQRSENCMEINWTSNHCWNDQGCSTSMGFMCERKL